MRCGCGNLMMVVVGGEMWLMVVVVGGELWLWLFDNDVGWSLEVAKVMIFEAGEQNDIVCCFTFQQHASLPRGRICSGNFTCCHTEIEVGDQTFHLTRSQYTDTGPTSL